MECFKELGIPTNEFTKVEFQESNCYQITCSRNHKSTTCLQEQKFEILFEIGAHAILDGYYREAVLSFTSSLERFYEFAIRIFLEKSSASEKLFNDCWRGVSSQSERQLGAFIFLWANNLDEMPILLNEKEIKFRNKVIHQGYIPSRIEAIDFGNKVLSTLNPKINKLNQLFPEEIRKIVFSHLQNSRKNSSHDNISTMSISTILSRNCLDENQKDNSLEQHLVKLDQLRNVMGIFP